MTPLSPSRVDLRVPDNITQARHELHRAIDFGGDAECAAWARKWGEPAIAAGDTLSLIDPDEDYGWCSKAGDDLASAIEHAAAMQTALGIETPDLAAPRRRSGRLLERLQAISQRLEDGE